MTKMLRFSVTEQTGRTFDLPLEEAIKILKDNGVECDDWNECEIAEELYNCYMDDLGKHEKENCYFEAYVQDEEIYE